MNSSRVYCPCILGAEMPETRISIASPLLALHGVWEAGITNNHTPTMDTTTYPHVVSSRKRTRADISHSDDESHDHDENEQTKQKNTNENWPRFIVLESPHPTAPLSKISPFTVAKAIQGKFGTVKKITKMKSGALLIEASRESTAQQILATTELSGIAVTATAHRTLNTSKGVVKDYHKDLFFMSDEDILNELSEQGVTDVSRFFLKKDGQNIKTNTLFITFNTPTAPKELKIGYYIVKVQMYVPNPLRCFNCQKFGHSKKFCKNPLACWKCGSEGHDGSECTAETTCCLNCKGDHCASSKSCPIWIQEKDIQRIKTERGLSYGDARRLVTSQSSSSVAQSYASAVKNVPKKITMSVDCQTPASWVGPQPSLRDASRLPSVITTSTGTCTSATNNRPIHKSSPVVTENPTSKSNKKSETHKLNEKSKETTRILKPVTSSTHLHRTWAKTWTPLILLDLQGRSLAHVVGRNTFRLLKLYNGYHTPMKLSRTDE